MKEDNKNRLALNMSRVFDLPEDVLLGLPRVTLNGNNNLLIENHRGVLVYTSFQIVVDTQLNPIDIKGSRLSIKSINKTEIRVEGNIRFFEYSKRDEVKN